MNSHAELSAQLARALGYYPESVRVFEHHPNAEMECQVYRQITDDPRSAYWQRFDYRDTSVALPVLEWLMREHGLSPYWHQQAPSYVIGHVVANTLPEAVARAAIAVKERK